jgi:tetratricopeptide (TPR) repeat protein
LHVAYGNALIAARGYGAPETTEAFARARKSAVGEKDAADRLAADYGLWVGSYVRGELSAMRAYAETFLGDVAARLDSPEAGVAHRVAGMTYWFAGEYFEAREHLERALALFQPDRDENLAFRFGQDPVVAATLNLAIVSWPLGDIGRAVSLVREARARIAAHPHIGTRAYGNWHGALFELMRGDLSNAAWNGVEVLRLAREHDLRFGRALGIFLEGLASAEGGASGGGLENMHRGIELLREQNVSWFDGLLKTALAEAEDQAGNTDRALEILDQTLATSERIGHHSFDAELHRVRGEMLLKRDPANPASAEEALQTAIAVAKKQGTRSFELRAALALAKLYQSTARPVEAHDVLAEALEDWPRFPVLSSGRRAGDEGSARRTQGSDALTPDPSPEGERGDALAAEMPEIAEAQALLAALAETDEVKSAAASRQRRLQLQTRYGQAMMFSRGFAAEESKTAFARAQHLAAGVGDASERFDAYYGLFVGSLVRGELGLARETAESFLHDAENAGRMTEAAAARRNVGHVRLFQGDFIDARTNLAEALRTYDPERDRDAKFRFGVDGAAAAAGYLALASWALGDVERARALSEEALTRADETAHAPTRANVYDTLSG